MTRPQLAPALLLATVTGATTLAALTSWRGFLEVPSEYIAPLGMVAVITAVTGALMRWAGSPVVLTFLAQAALVVAFVSNELGGGPVPVGATADRIGRSLELAVDSARTYAAPIGTDVPPVSPLLIVGGALFVLLVDLLACSLRRVPVSGLALLAVYSVPAGLVQTSPGWVAFVCAAAGFLAMLHLDARDSLMRWGRPLITAQDNSSWTEGNPLAGAAKAGAGRIGATATAFALMVPPLVPVLDLDLLGFGPGDGDDSITIRNPRADMRQDLERGQARTLLQVTTDGPAPSYVRIGVLNRFTGDEWSSGNRVVDGENDADGDPLPEPEGLDPDVPRETYDYEIEAFEELDSSWLPAPYPAASVEAEGDWRYDVDTIDFLARPDDLTTAGLSYEATAIVPDYGTTGEFFNDAVAGAVDEEVSEVPPGLPSSIRMWAQEATAGARNDYQRALMLQDFFRQTGGFRYSLDEAPEGIGSQTLEGFLDPEEGRVGYCEQYASAMAVMARILGIPARYVVGFLQPSQVDGDTYQFDSHDLHAWPELYFEGAGWVRFEPTPSGPSAAPGSGPEDVPDHAGVAVPRPEPPTDQPTTRGASPGEGRSGLEPSARQTTFFPEEGAATRAEDEGARDEGAGWREVLLWGGVALAALCLVLAAAAAPRLLRRRLRERRLAGGPDEVWEELRGTAIDLGVPWQDGRSPRQLGVVLVEHLGDHEDVSPAVRPRTGARVDPDATAALDRIVGIVERTRYTRPGSAGPSETLAADAELCIASLRAGVTERARRRATWFPRSLWQPASDGTVEAAREPTKVG